MNERIKELIEQATESTGFLTAGDSVPPLPVREFNKEKFALLIVGECCDLIYDRGEHSDGSVTKYKIRKHFGLVE